MFIELIGETDNVNYFVNSNQIISLHKEADNITGVVFSGANDVWFCHNSLENIFNQIKQLGAKA